MYLISQTVNNDYDAYDSAVVVASSGKEAKRLHPNGKLKLPADDRKLDEFENLADYWDYRDWVRDPKDVKVRLIGVAVTGLKAGEVICSSFNAG